MGVTINNSVSGLTGTSQSNLSKTVNDFTEATSGDSSFMSGMTPEIQDMVNQVFNRMIVNFYVKMVDDLKESLR